MRTLLAATLLMVSGFSLKAQDPGMDAALAAQQAGLQAQQAAQQQMQQAQEASQRASDMVTQQMMQNTADASQNSTNCCVGFVFKPTFSVKQGVYPNKLEVKIRDKTRGAVIYYTTDGWTPTKASTRYIGPVSIDSTTKLQAIAVAPAGFPWRSVVATAQYTVTGTAAKNVATSAPLPAMAGVSDVAQKAAANDRPPVTSVDVIPMLREGTPVRLVFVADVNSKTADVGDKIALTLADDIKSGDTVLVAKGATAQAVITEVEKTGAGGAPGDIAFQVNALNINGMIVKLRGGATMEGEPKPPNAAILIPVVGGLTILRHGKDAEIKAGMSITAYVDVDSDIAPAKPADEQKK